MASERVYGINFKNCDGFYVSGYVDKADPDPDQVKRSIQVMIDSPAGAIADVTLYLDPVRARKMAAEFVAAADAVDAAARDTQMGEAPAVEAPEEVKPNT